MLSQLALGLLLLARSPDCEEALQSKISITSGPARLENLLPELSKTAKVPLLFDATTKDEIVVLRVADVTTSELLKKIADVCSALWTPEGSGYRLTRPASLDQNEARSERAAVENAIRLKLARAADGSNAPGLSTVESARAYVAELGQMGDPPEDERGSSKWSEKAFELMRRMPLKRAAARICALLDAKAIAGLAEGNWVFSNAPNRMQIALPARSNAILADLIREQNILAPLMPKDEDPEAGGGATTGGGGGGPPEGEIDFGILGTYTTATLPPDAKILVILTKGRDAEIDVTMEVLDAEGNAVASTYALGSDSDLFDLVPRFGKQSDGAPAAKPEDALPVPADIAELSKWQPGVGTGVSQSILGKLLRPEDNDPMSFSKFALLPALSERLKLNLVARVPDDPDFLFMDTGVTNTTPGSLKTEVVERGLMIWKEEQGWLTLMSRRPHLSRLRQLDRAVLGNAVRAVERQKVLSLDQLVKLSSESRGDSEGVSWFDYLTFMLEPEWAGLNYRPSQEFARLYGSFSAAQKRDLLSDAGLSISALTAPQRAIANRMVFQIGIVFRQGAGPTGKKEIAEATEAMPDGIPPDAVLRGVVARASIYLGNSMGNKRIMASPLTSKGLARSLLNKERYPEMGSRSFDTFLPIVQNRFTIRFDLQSNLSASFIARYYELVAGAKDLTYDQLPTAFRDEVQKELARLREVMKNVPRGDDKPPPTR